MGFGHLPELLIILVIGLIVFGPEKLPEVAANIGKMVREVRSAMDTALHPDEETPPDDFSAYYYESLARSGEAVPVEAADEDFSMFPGGTVHSREGAALYDQSTTLEPEPHEIGQYVPLYEDARSSEAT